MRTFKFALLMITGALGSALAVGTAAAATVDDGAPTQVVRYSSQTLETDGGVQQLYARLVNAAKQVCPDSPLKDLGASVRVQECRSQAIAHAIQHINNSQLAALYATTSKRG
jgi:UrcA family protein